MRQFATVLLTILILSCSSGLGSFSQNASEEETSSPSADGKGRSPRDKDRTRKDKDEGSKDERGDDEPQEEPDEDTPASGEATKDPSGSKPDLPPGEGKPGEGGGDSPKDTGPTEDGPEGSKPAIDTGEAGPYKTATYSEGLTDQAYQSAIVHYPVNAPTPKVAATSLSGGYQMKKEQMLWLAERLASHGFIVMTFTPTEIGTLNPGIWATGHKGVIAKLKTENEREGSPIKGKVNVERLGISGFSMGGAGTIVAINELGTSVKAAVPICAYRPKVVSVSVPTMFITGTRDVLADPRPIIASYESMSSGAPKSLVNINGMRHSDVYDPPNQQRNIARYLIAWYQMHLVGNESYLTYLEGDELKEDRDAKVFASESDFRFAK
jgi:hypothetical protein